ncbi:hypothetical protein Tco_0836472 [Tanacetum coccineum]
MQYKLFKLGSTKVGSSRRVESFEDEGLGEEDASKQGRIANIDANEDIYLVNVQTDENMFGVNDLDDDEVIVKCVDVINNAKETRSVVEEVTAVTIPVSAATTTTITIAIIDVEITLAQTMQRESIYTTFLYNTITCKENTFVDYITELVEESSKKAETDLVKESSKKAKAEIAHESSLKRAGEELEQESSKKQKLKEDKESEELKQCLEIIPDDGDDVTIDATPLSTRSLTIVLYKIYKKGKKSYFQIIRADGNSQIYLTFGKMLKNIDKEDLEVL